MPRVAMIRVSPRRYKKGDIVKVKSIIMHPMHTGLTKDKKTGKIIPADYINKVEVYYGDEKITTFDLKGSVSANPFLEFYIKADKKAPLKMVWKDITGDVTEKTIQIKPKG
ncbi:thiosulfate oxidation carrier complex protein SoxZ [Hydrogenothermus marinus]|uniref:Sulfur-oxidizing protein SoxZ n=1 Tax=Hydrogenothermus marinus TaxID=133270 RepID=A0A3M0BHT9_9AQUI|nr:thiosulfate oxidation carrier complex protein SoxZ [Hydrogenothermus marinus]RMA96136.1 sulfur-oxidizing protein SoxZ [Hydrogenothermus marinus]